MNVKTYRRHYCTRQHRSYQTMARCIWRRAEWVIGEGPYALLAHCRVLTVTLYAEEERAAKVKAMIDKNGCGGVCFRSHEIVRLAINNHE